MSPKLKDLDDFYAKCSSPEWAQFARGVIDRWLDIPGTREGHNAQSMVALYHPSPSQPIAGSNVLQLGTNEQITVCRGYILGTNAFDDDPTILDDQIRSFFPNANWQGKNYHLRVDPDRDGLAGFLAWLADYLARAIEGVPA